MLRSPHTSTNEIVTIPFLKWPGGKRWFVRQYSHILPSNYQRYIEPFLGGGSVYFHLRPRHALLGDINEDLIITYTAIRNDWKRIQSLLELHSREHSHEYYYEVRSTIFTDVFQRAARFIYLNRTCFNGIYRVNLLGEFNVPKGSKDSVLLSTDNFEELSKLLKNAELNTADFVELIDDAGRNDFLFIDPPYTVRHNVNGFIKYNENLFSWEDQVKLAGSLERAKKRGAKIVATNANHDTVKDLYTKHGFKFDTVSRFSSISADAGRRSQYEELLITANL